MLDLGTGVTLKSYLATGAQEEVARIDVAFSRTSCSSGFEDAIRMGPGCTVAAFVELFCPDAAVLLPYLSRIEEINDQIRIHFFSVKGNEVLLQNLTGVAKIPTLVILDEDDLPVGYYVEYPKAFKDRMALLEGESRRHLLRDFREGEMGDLIEKDLVRLLRNRDSFQ